jgi:hypothetical protein
MTCFLTMCLIDCHLLEELSIKLIVPGASIPNRLAYKSNPEETKEFQRLDACWMNCMGHVFSQKLI